MGKGRAAILLFDSYIADLLIYGLKNIPEIIHLFLGSGVIDGMNPSIPEFQLPDLDVASGAFQVASFKGEGFGGFILILFQILPAGVIQSHGIIPSTGIEISGSPVSGLRFQSSVFQHRQGLGLLPVHGHELKVPVPAQAYVPAPGNLKGDGIIRQDHGSKVLHSIKDGDGPTTDQK